MDLNAPLVMIDTINVKITDDRYNSSLSDIAVLEVNGVEAAVTCDYNNSAVKAFFTKANQPRHSKLSLDSNPYSLTQVSNNQVAVTVEKAKQIVTIEVNPDLKLLSTITTSKQYHGITTLTPSTIAASSSDPSSIDILDMSGTVVKSLTPSINNKPILQSPCYLSTARNGNIVVSDTQSKSVLCLTPQGDVVFNYSPTGAEALMFPRGVTVTSGGDILLAEIGRGRGVLHLSESGEFVKNILTSQNGVSGPQGVCAYGQGKVYVCFFVGAIKVFKCIV